MTDDLIGEDTDWIEDFMMLQSYAADRENGREPSNLVSSYLQQYPDLKRAVEEYIL
jgi:hypothetical protein